MSVKHAFGIIVTFFVSVFIYKGQDIMPRITLPSSVTDVPGFFNTIGQVFSIIGSGVGSIMAELNDTPFGNLLIAIILFVILVSLIPVILRLGQIVAEVIPF